MLMMTSQVSKSVDFTKTQNSRYLKNETQEIKFHVNDHFVDVLFTHCLLCTNDYLFLLNTFAHKKHFSPSPVQGRSFLNLLYFL